MYKGKYILLPINEFKYSISNYLNINFNLIYEEDENGESSVLKLNFTESDIFNKDITDVISKIVGHDNNTIKKAKYYFNNNKNISFNIKDCSFMLSLIFDTDNAIFDTEVILAYDERFIHLFYLNKDERFIKVHSYICKCGTNFNIQNKTDDNGILLCPYCGLKRDDMGDDILEGQPCFKVEETEL